MITAASICFIYSRELEFDSININAFSIINHPVYLILGIDTNQLLLPSIAIRFVASNT